MNTPIPAQDVRPDPGAISRSCILALDPGTMTGRALRAHDGLITSGTVPLRPGRFDGTDARHGSGGQRVRRAPAATVPPHPGQVRRDGWREQGVLAVPADDRRLAWLGRELVRQPGANLDAPPPSPREARHG